MNTDSLSKSSNFWSFISYAWLVWGCGALFYCFQFMLRVSPGVMTNDLMRDFQIDACALGTLTAFYYYAYSSLQIPMGYLIDRIKPRRMITGAVIVCSLGNIFFSSSHTFAMGALGRALIGAGSAAAFLSCVKLATLWFPKRQLPLLVGLTVSLGTLGAISAGTPMGWLVEEMGWKAALWNLSFVGFAIGALAWFVIRDKDETQPQSEEVVEKTSIIDNLKHIISNPQTWIFAAYGSLMYVPLSGFADMWGAPFMMSYFGVDKATAGSAVSIFYLGLGLGSPVFSFLCNRLNTYKPLLLWPPLIATVLFSIILYGGVESIIVTNTLLFLCGMVLGTQFLIFPMVCTINPQNRTATASGLHNMMCMMSGVVAQPLIGYLLKFFSPSAFDYDLLSYQYALAIIPVALIISAILVRFMVDVKPE